MKKLVIISSTLLLLAACGGNAKDTVKDAVKDTAQKNTEMVKESAGKVADKAKDVVADTASTVKEKAPAAFDKKAAVTEAKMITKAFGSNLKGELMKAMKAGGPLNALEVCNTQANPITMQAAKEHNAIITRVSLKNRNPANVPNDWQKMVLEEFDARAEKGEDVAKMGFADIVEHNGKKRLRFMKALPTGKACLTCHGSNVSKSVKEKLAELYPNDKAIGYELGQVRGAVVILKDYN